jgi:hypothetical protein
VADAVSAKADGSWASLCSILAPGGAASRDRSVPIGADLTCPGPQAQR